MVTAQRRLGPGGLPSHLCPSSALHPPQETLQLFHGAASGGLWEVGAWLSEAGPLVAGLVARGAGRSAILALGAVALEKDLRWLLRALEP